MNEQEIGAVELQPPTKRGSQGDEELKGKFGLDDCPDPLDLEATLQMELPPLRSVVMRNAEGVAAHQAIVQLGASEYAAYEKDGVVKIKVERVGCLDGVATVGNFSFSFYHMTEYLTDLILLLNDYLFSLSREEEVDVYYLFPVAPSASLSSSSFQIAGSVAAASTESSSRPRLPTSMSWRSRIASSLLIAPSRFCT